MLRYQSSMLAVVAVYSSQCTLRIVPCCNWSTEWHSSYSKSQLWWVLTFWFFLGFVMIFLTCSFFICQLISFYKGHNSFFCLISLSKNVPSSWCIIINKRDRKVYSMAIVIFWKSPWCRWFSCKIWTQCLSWTSFSRLLDIQLETHIYCNTWHLRGWKLDMFVLDVI